MQIMNELFKINYFIAYFLSKNKLYIYIFKKMNKFTSIEVLN